MATVKKVINNGCCYEVGESPDNTRYGSSWSGSCKAPTQDAIYAKFQGVKEFNPSNTGSNGQILQKTSSGYAWCNNSSSGSVIKPTNRVRCSCSGNTNSEVTYTIPNDGIIYTSARQDCSRYGTAYVTINNGSTCVGGVYNYGNSNNTMTAIETVRAGFTIKANSTCGSAGSWSFLYTSF